MNIRWLFNTLCRIAYPLAIYLGLRYTEPRYVALFLLLSLLLFRRHDALRLLGGRGGMKAAALAGLILLAGAAAASNNELCLRLYPAAVSIGLLLLFGYSLRRPPSFVEKIARLSDPALSAAGVSYTRRVTQMWCLFFILNGGVAIYTALYSSREIWAFYNGFLAYVMMGLLFAAEWLVRRHYIAAPTQSPK